MEGFSTAPKWIYFVSVRHSIHSRTLRQTEHDVRVTEGVTIVWARNGAHSKGSLSETKLIYRNMNGVDALLYALIA